MRTLILILATILSLGFCTNISAHYDSTTDPINEEFPDTALDLVFIGQSALHVITYGSGWGALALDIGCLFIPGATGAGSIYRASKHTDEIISSGKNILTGSQAAKHADHFGHVQTNIGKGVASDLLDISKRAMFNGVKWSSSHMNKWLTHVAERHSGALDLAQRMNTNTISNASKFFDEGVEGMHKVLNEAMQKMGNGEFIMKTDIRFCPHNFVMITVDMGKTVGNGLNRAGDYYKCTAVNIIIGPKGHGTMYPVKNAYEGAQRQLNSFDIEAMVEKL